MVSVSASRANWFSRVRKMPAAKRIEAIENRLKRIPKTPTAANVFFRKELLRLQDASRLEAGMVNPQDLHRENSSFVGLNFRSAKINFRVRARG